MRCGLISALFAFMVGAAVHAQTAPEHPPAADYCVDQKTEGWYFYCAAPVEESEPEAEPQPVAAPPPPAPAPLTFSEQMEMRRIALDELKNKAILQPTSENLEAYMRAQRETVQMAGHFAEVWQRTIFETPELDANIKHPITSIGTNFRNDLRNEEMEASLRSATTELGLMYVYGGSESCPQCTVQTPIVASMSKQYEVDVLPVSVDGFVSPEFPGTRFNSGQLKSMGLDEVPLPFLALVDPKRNQVQLVGAGIMTTDIILSRIRIIHTVKEGTLYAQ